MLHGTDNTATDNAAALLALDAGDIIYLVGANGHVEVTLDAKPTGTDVITVTGTQATDGTPPSGSEAVSVLVNATPSPAPPPAPPSNGQGVDPGDLTITEVQDYVESLGDPNAPATRAEVQRLLDAERGGKDRASLVDWLDKRPHIV